MVGVLSWRFFGLIFVELVEGPAAKASQDQGADGHGHDGKACNDRTVGAWQDKQQ